MIGTTERLERDLDRSAAREREELFNQIEHVMEHRTGETILTSEEGGEPVRIVNDGTVDEIGHAEYGLCEAVCDVTYLTYNKHLEHSPFIEYNEFGERVQSL